MKLLYEIADIFETPVAEGETLEQLLTRMDKQGRFDFKRMQGIVTLLCKRSDDKDLDS